MDCVHFTVKYGEEETQFVFLVVNDDFEYVEKQLKKLKKLVAVFRTAQTKTKEEILDELLPQEADLLDEIEEEYADSGDIIQFVRDYATVNNLTLADCVDEFFCEI